MMKKNIGIRVPCTIMRGGTSKGIFFYEKDVPPEGEARDKFLCAVMGSPDRRQIDGLGGADPLTSKVAIIGPSQSPDADILYTFAQVNIRKASVDYLANCGNITSAVGLFAVQEGLVPPAEPFAEVKIFNTNTSKILRVFVPCKDGKPEEEGNFIIDGVPGSGPRLDLDMSGTIGAVSGKLLPTGNPSDRLYIPDYGEFECSIVDIANPCIFVRSESLGLTGLETPDELETKSEVMGVLEKIRGMAGVIIGLASNLQSATSESPAVPMVCFIASPGPDDKEVNLISRIMFMQVMHKTYSGTAAVCTAVAAKIPGTIPYECAKREGGEFIIAHPAGTIGVTVDVLVNDSQIEVNKAAFGRTARRILDGYVYVQSGKAFGDNC